MLTLPSPLLIHAPHRQGLRWRFALCLWLTLCGFVLGTLAYSGHIHTAAHESSHEQCDLCAGFAGTLAPPKLALLHVPVADVARPVTAALPSPAATPTIGLPGARAPPVSC